MAQVSLAAYRGVQNVMTTELNALGSATGKAVSGVLDNSISLDLWADFQLSVTFASAPVLNAIVELYLLPSLDLGTTYPDGSASVLASPNLYAGGFPVRAVTTAQTILLRGIPLPPSTFILQVQNTTTVAFPATGSTLDMNTYAMKSE